MKVQRFKQAQRFRVIVGSACFYATAKQIRNGVGDFVNCNHAVQKALGTLEFQRSGGYKNAGVLEFSTGLAGTWEGLQVQLNVA
jgi:hypothetical protein